MPRETEVTVAYRCLPADLSLWLVIYVPSVRRFYPQGTALVTISGSPEERQIEAIVGVGAPGSGDVGKSFYIHLVEANQAGSAGLSAAAANCSSSSCGILRMPKGTADLHKVLVFRR